MLGARCPYKRRLHELFDDRFDMSTDVRFRVHGINYIIVPRRATDRGDVLCKKKPCAVSTSSPKDGSDGTFFCINGGSVGGITGSCTYTSCNAGCGRPSCETAGGCSTSTNSSKDGSDGSFYCINGGTVGGIAGSCTCTSCNSGYDLKTTFVYFIFMMIYYSIFG